MQYFIHADDFGRRPESNAAIDEGVRLGLIQRATLMVNMEDTEEAVAMAERGGYRDRVCFHLNLSNGAPLTEPIRKTFFCGADGRFRSASLKTMIVKGMTPGAVGAIRQECEAQMRRFRDLGFPSSHMDAHFWCMCAGPVWRAARPLMEKYGFRTTRTMRGHQLDTAHGALRTYYASVFRSVGRTLQCPEDRALLFREFKKNAVSGGFGENERIELYVHPRMVDGVCRDVRNAKITEDQFPLSEIAAEAALCGTMTEP